MGSKYKVTDVIFMGSSTIRQKQGCPKTVRTTVDGDLLDEWRLFIRVQEARAEKVLRVS